MRLSIFLFLVTVTSLAKGQTVIDVSKSDANVVGQEQLAGNVGGVYFNLIKYVKVKEGSPYFIDDWSKGAIVLPGGKTFNHLDIKLNLLDNEVHYMGADGKEMVASVPISEVLFGDSTTPTHYTFINGSTLADQTLSNIWLEVLVNDKVSLMHQLRKKILTGSNYGSATEEQTIQTADFYYLQMNGKLQRVGSFSDLPGMFGWKKEMVAQFIKTNHLRGKSPTDYAQVVEYYNKLNAAG
ncbi:MAG: hypothetical protein JST68_02125 [Bacteroidetes bacterium]|nr:hypothetical protein [Bacteroidota bacterium]